MNARMSKVWSMTIKLWLVLKWVNQPNLLDVECAPSILSWDNDANVDGYVYYEQSNMTSSLIQT